MKRLAILAMVVLLAFGATAVAEGLFLGISIAPVAGSAAGVTFGYDFDYTMLEVWKSDLTTVYGVWDVAALYTPDVKNFGYRGGIELGLEYFNTGELVWNGFSVVLGISKSWGGFQIYGDLELMPVGIFQARPEIGFNILFGDILQGIAVEPGV